MDKETLRRLGLLNQLSLTEAQKEDIISFFADRENDLKTLEKIDTAASGTNVAVGLCAVGMCRAGAEYL